VAQQRQAIDVGEAQRAADVDRVLVVIQDGADGGDLSVDAVDEFGLVAPGDGQDVASL